MLMAKLIIKGTTNFEAPENSILIGRRISEVEFSSNAPADAVVQLPLFIFLPQLSPTPMLKSPVPPPTSPPQPRPQSSGQTLPRQRQHPSSPPPSCRRFLLQLWERSHLKSILISGTQDVEA